MFFLYVLLFFSLLLSVCICVYVCRYTQMAVHMYAYICIWRPEDTLGCCSIGNIYLLFYFSQAVYLTGLDLAKWARLADQ